MTKDLKEKAIKVKGGAKYVLVKDRVLYFNETYPNGSIDTEIVEILGAETDSPIFVVKATVSTGWMTSQEDGHDEEVNQTFTGLSQAKLGGSGANKEAALENAESSAVGRALAFMGIGVIDSIASVDEMKKAGVSPDGLDL